MLVEAFPRAPQGSLRALAGCFGFSGDDVDKAVRVLSGGEKRALRSAPMSDASCSSQSGGSIARDLENATGRRTIIGVRCNCDRLALLILPVVALAGCAGGGGGPSPTCSEANGSVVFASTRSVDGADFAIPKFPFNIWRVNADGTCLTPLTNATANWIDSSSPQIRR
jgi:hypothetical protein